MRDSRSPAEVRCGLAAPGGETVLNSDALAENRRRLWDREKALRAQKEPADGRKAPRKAVEYSLLAK